MIDGFKCPPLARSELHPLLPPDKSNPVYLTAAAAKYKLAYDIIRALPSSRTLAAGHLCLDELLATLEQADDSPTTAALLPLLRTGGDLTLAGTTALMLLQKSVPPSALAAAAKRP